MIKKYKKKKRVVQNGTKWDKKRRFLSTNSFYPGIKRFYYVIISEGKVSRHENFAKCVGAVVRRCSTK